MSTKIKTQTGWKTIAGNKIIKDANFLNASKLVHYEYYASSPDSEDRTITVTGLTPGKIYFFYAISPAISIHFSPYSGYMGFYQATGCTVIKDNFTIKDGPSSPYPNLYGIVVQATSDTVTFRFKKRGSLSYMLGAVCLPSYTGYTFDRTAANASPTFTVDSTCIGKTCTMISFLLRKFTSGTVTDGLCPVAPSSVTTGVVTDMITDTTITAAPNDSTAKLFVLVY